MELRGRLQVISLVSSARRVACSLSPSPSESATIPKCVRSTAEYAAGRDRNSRRRIPALGAVEKAGPSGEAVGSDGNAR